MPQNYYRFWSKYSIYKSITRLVQEEGVNILSSLHRGRMLYQWDVYDFGLARHQKYPPNSVRIIGMDPEPIESFSATPFITTESEERLIKLERKYGLDSIPEKRRVILYPQEAWSA